MKTAILVLFLFAPFAHADTTSAQCFSLPHENQINVAQVCLRSALSSNESATVADLFSEQNELIESVPLTNLNEGNSIGDGNAFQVRVNQVSNNDGSLNTVGAVIRHKDPGQGPGDRTDPILGRFGSSGAGTQCNPGVPSHC